jgi:hypothetical protein
MGGTVAITNVVVLIMAKLRTLLFLSNNSLCHTQKAYSTIITGEPEKHARFRLFFMKL